MILHFLSFVTGLSILLYFANFIIKRLKKSARIFLISPLTLTLLGISVLASFPELFISLIAAIGKHSDVSLGIIIGSNLFTLLFILGIIAVVHPFHVRMVIEERDSTWMLLAGTLLLLFARNGISRVEGGVLMLSYAPYIYSVYSAEKKKKIEKYKKTKNGKLKEIIILVGSVGVMVLGGEMVVKGGTNIAKVLKVSPFVMGVIMLGIGSSIPETTIGITAALKKKIDVTLGDVYGTNIFTLLFILGLSAFIEPIPVTQHIIYFTIPYFIFATIILQFFMTTGHRIGRIEGIFLLLLYTYFLLVELNVIPDIFTSFI